MTDDFDISSEIALRWTSLDLNNDKSTLVQVMAWCCQATTHYLNQCWSRSLPPYGVTRPHWVKLKSYDTWFIHDIYFTCTIFLKFSLEHGLITTIHHSFDDKSQLNGSGNGLVPSSNKPFTEPMLTRMYVLSINYYMHNQLDWKWILIACFKPITSPSLESYESFTQSFAYYRLSLV